MLRILTLFVLAALSPHAAYAELKPATSQAFDKYAQLTEARIEAGHQDTARWLYPDALSPEQRNALYTRLKAGEVVIERLQTRDQGREIDVPGGIIHHWVGVAFIPRATLTQTLALVQDYDNHSRYYAPDVSASKLISRDGARFKIFLQFYKKKILTVVMNTDHDALYQAFGKTREYSRSATTRVTQVEDYGGPGQHELNVGEGRGFLWRLNSYWHFEEKDGGVYVQCEAITLTGAIPLGFGWLIKPFVTSVPKESLFSTMMNTKKALKR